MLVYQRVSGYHCKGSWHLIYYVYIYIIYIYIYHIMWYAIHPHM